VCSSAEGKLYHILLQRKTYLREAEMAFITRPTVKREDEGKIRQEFRGHPMNHTDEGKNGKRVDVQRQANQSKRVVKRQIE